jgi:hypothetical protein
LPGQVSFDAGVERNVCDLALHAFAADKSSAGDDSVETSKNSSERCLRLGCQVTGDQFDGKRTEFSDILLLSRIA